MQNRFDVEEITKDFGIAHGQLAELLMTNHVGERNAITARHMRRKGYGDAVFIRYIVHNLRVAGIPICSGSKGYYFAENLDELTTMVISLSGRAEAIMKAHEGLLKSILELDERM